MAKTPYERNKNAIKKYIAEKTDDIRIRVPKGTKDIWKAYAKNQGISLNALIIKLMEEEINKNSFDR